MTCYIQRNKDKMTAVFSLATVLMRRWWSNIFKVLEGKKLSARILYPVKIFFKKRPNTFTDIEKRKDFIISRPSLQEMPKEVSQIEGNNKNAIYTGK